MNLIYVIVFVISVVCAVPEHKEVSKQDIVVDLIAGQFISHPSTFNEKQTTEAFSIANSIKRLVDEVLENIPDPVKIEDLQDARFILGEDTSITVSTHGVRISGLSSLYTDTLRINLLIPVRPRITYKFVLPKLVIDIGHVSIKININGIVINCYIRGQVTITDSNVQGTATINAISHTLTDLTTVLHVGTIHSSLVGNANGVNTTNLINTIVSDIIPQILSIFSNVINELLARIILGIF